MFSAVNYLIFSEYTAKLVISGLIGAYTAYYFLAARSVSVIFRNLSLYFQPPVLYGRSKKLLNFFRSHVPFLSEIYSPFVFGFTGRIQTVLRPIFHRTDKVDYEE